MRLCHDYDISLLFVIIPTKRKVYPFLTELSFLEYENISYVDLLPLFRDKANLNPRNRLNSKLNLYFRYDSHWNENGSLLGVLLVRDFILESSFIDIKDKSDAFKH